MESKQKSPAVLERLVEEVRAARLPSAARRRWIREEAGVSLREAAKVMGVNKMTVYHWENGREPTRSNAIIYGQFLEALEQALK